MSRTAVKTGKTILRVLTEAEREGAHVHALLQRAQETMEDNRTRAFASALVRGVVQRYLTLDYAINLFADKKTTQMKPVIRNILRMGAYEILFMDRVPDAAAVDACVRLAQASGFRMLSGFVNGVLRHLVREKDNIEYPTKSIRYSVPDWICSLLENAYGTEETERMLAYCNEPSPLTLRFDERLDRAEILRQVRIMRRASEDLALTQHPLLSYAYGLRHGMEPRLLPGYQEGVFAVQDVGTMLIAEACGVKAGDIVVDVCASPGGKALHLAARMEALARAEAEAENAPSAGNAGGFVYAFDVNEKKCARIRENAARLKVSNIKADVWDGRNTRPDLAGMADVVLCDVPCTGLGVLSRRADIRYRVKPDDVFQLSALQREIVRAAAGYLKPGGTLLYATCTLTWEENGGNRRFIERDLGLAPSSLLPYLPKQLAGERTLRDGYLTLLPGRYETDGFFLARFTK